VSGPPPSNGSGAGPRSRAETQARGAGRAEMQARIAGRVVGRRRELELILAAVAAGRDLLLEGPPGTSKSTLLRAITAEWGIPLVFVEGNADLTPAKLVGHHNPARVLREDYSADNFVDGPLLEAMRAGGFLYIEEFNRAPEDTLNTLLTAMAEREVAVPRVGRVAAQATFRVIASMNPYDNVGTTRLSTGIHDRLCRLAVTYQDAESERGIVALRAPLPSGAVPAEVAATLVADAVALTRATRQHPDVRQGSSVRGAIDLTLVAGELLVVRGSSGAASSGPASTSGGASSGRASTSGAASSDRASTSGGADYREADYRETVFDAMLVALSGRIHLDETAESSPEAVLRQIWEDHFILNPAEAAPG
jgi:MoxR-like ATPase